MPTEPDDAQYPNQNMGLDFIQDANAGAVNQLNAPLQLANAGVVAATISSGTGVPAGGGNVGDLYIRINPAGDSTYLYRCTVAGAAGAATWAAISGA